MTSIVSDATALIILAKLDRLDVLESLFTSVIIPSTVYAEITIKPDHDTARWHQGLFSIQDGSRLELCSALQAILDPGEGEAIALATQLQLPLLMDEKKGRSIARSQGITVIGLVGVLLALRKNGILDQAAIVELLDGAMQAGFRLSPKLHEDFMRHIER